MEEKPFIKFKIPKYSMFGLFTYQTVWFIWGANVKVGKYTLGVAPSQ